MDELRAAFDDDDVARKNIALRKASDEIARLRAALLELDAMYRRIAPDDPEGLHPDLHPAWKACKAALRP